MKTNTKKFISSMSTNLSLLATSILAIIISVTVMKTILPQTLPIYAAIGILLAVVFANIIHWSNYKKAKNHTDDVKVSKHTPVVIGAVFGIILSIFAVLFSKLSPAILILFVTLIYFAIVVKVINYFNTGGLLLEEAENDDLSDFCFEKLKEYIEGYKNLFEQTYITPNSIDFLPEQTYKIGLSRAEKILQIKKKKIAEEIKNRVYSNISKEEKEYLKKEKKHFCN